MRDLMMIVEDDRRTFKHVAFDQVSWRDIIRAMIEVEDLRTVLESGTWDQIDFGEDDDGDPIEYSVPRRMADLTPEQYAAISEFFADERGSRVREYISKYAKMPLISVSRRLNRLGDLSRPLGVHWSAGETANEHTSHYGSISVHGRVANEHVDWTTTLARGLFFWDEEREITICANAPIDLVSMTFGDQHKGIA